MLDQYILDIDGIKKFFSNMDNVVKCVDRSESDVIIEICNDLGYDVYSRHNPNGCYHGVYCLYGVDIMFTKMVQINGHLVFHLKNGWEHMLEKIILILT